MIKARRKIDPNLFYNVNNKIHDSLQNHVFALDGSNARVSIGFKKYGYSTRTCNKVMKRPAKRPLLLLITRLISLV